VWRARIARFDLEYKYRPSAKSTSGNRKVQAENVSSAENFGVAVVLTTLGADADAAALARTLVGEGLAACVNVLPAMTSIYRWHGQVEQDREQQMVIKTAAARLPALAARLQQLHPYELPEFVVLSASASEAYLAWVCESVG
jgi:periplasmic divalent cation tolerance protein